MSCARWALLPLCGLGLLGFGGSGCGSAPAEPPSILLVTIDTLRADRIEPYGYAGSHTPHLQQLADEGILFENAISDTTWTIPSVGSLMTGLYPFDHGVQTPRDRLGELPTLASLLGEHGYRTAAIIGSFPLERRFGFSRGFASYDDEMNTPFQKGPREEPPDAWFDGSPEERDRWFLARNRTRSYRPDNEVADRAIAWLEAGGTEPFFLWVHFFGPHERRHVEPQRWRSQAITNYDRLVEFTDSQVGRLLGEVRARPDRRIAVVLHSDHGQTLDEHQYFGHGLDLYDTTARVPLIVRLPDGERAGERVRRVVRNVDIFPTVLGLARIPAPEGLRGVDLLGGDEEASGPAYIETHMMGRGRFAKPVELDGEWLRIATVLRGLRTERWKLVVKEPAIAWDWEEGSTRALPPGFVQENRSVELYDLESDPDEKTSVAESETEVVLGLLRLLDSHSPSGPRRAEREALDEATRAGLQALGYLEDAEPLD